MGGVRMIGRYAGHTSYRAGTLRELCVALEPRGDKAPRAGGEMMTFATFLARHGVGGVSQWVPPHDERVADVWFCEAAARKAARP